MDACWINELMSLATDHGEAGFQDVGGYGEERADRGQSWHGLILKGS